MAQNVERYNSSGERTAYGTDVADVQTSQNASEGDVIKILEDAAHHSTVSNASGYAISTFSVTSGNPNDKKTVSATTANISLYDFSNSNYQVSFTGLDYQGIDSAVNKWGAFMHFGDNSSADITLNNVSVTGFNTNYSGGAFSFTGTNSPISITAKNAVSFINNTANHEGNDVNNYGKGGAIYISENNLDINSDVIIFKNNSANRYGAAIAGGSASEINITGSNILFDNNVVTNNDGGAIQTNGTLKITGANENAVTTFSNNKAKNIGGALSVQTAVYLSTGSFYFDSNELTAVYSSMSSHSGGAIDTSLLSIKNAKEVSFTNNVSLYTGGAINICDFVTGGVSEIEADTIIFDTNTSQGFGGAIHSWKDFTIKGNSITFTNNESITRGSSQGDGGAIRDIGLLTFTGSGDNSEVVFQNNFATRYGAAICGYDLSMTSFKTIKFYDNKSNNRGGVFYGYSVAFDGDDTTAYFIGNTAANAGNDIYLISGSHQTYLNFNGNGTYIFDGGIYLETGSTTIDKASVSLSGRENDTTNVYRLQNVTISNGGKLTANLDYINKIEGTQIKLSDSVSQVELTNALMNQTATVKSSTGNGTFILEYLAAAGNVQNESLVISSGRIDAKGCMAANVSVEANTTFSPGNSVGSVNIDGDFKLTGELLMEVDGTGADILTCDTFTMNSGTVVLNWQNDEIPFFSTLDIIISESTDLSGVYENLVENIDFSTSPTVERLYNDGYIKALLVGDNKIIQLSIDRNAVPEPSTWALLILGAAGLLYWRKRKN